MRERLATSDSTSTTPIRPAHPGPRSLRLLPRREGLDRLVERVVGEGVQNHALTLRPDPRAG